MPTPEPVVVEADGSRFMSGEAVVVLEARESAPPATAGRFRCAPAEWSTRQIVLLRCNPHDRDPATTRALIEALRATPGVKAADYNFVRERQ